MSIQDPHDGSSIGLLPAVLTADARDAVQSLQKLCLKAIGRQLKHFCNLRVQTAVAQELSGSERRLIDTYDLSRLDVFEPQAFLQSIEKWLVKLEQGKWKRHITPNAHQTMKSFLRCVLLPVTGNQPERPFRDLAIELSVEAPPKMQLREPSLTVKPRREWVSGKKESPEEGRRGEDGASSLATSPEEMKQDEMVCYRLSVGSVGCGLVAGVLQHSSSLVKLRLNNCDVTDAGAILLASGVRLTAVLQLLDLSNEESLYPEAEAMRNEIGDNGVRAIALALEHNQSLKEVDLSGNPIGSKGAMALASMIRKNTSLQRLYLDRSRVQGGAETLLQVYQTSKSLSHLSMLWCGLRPGVGKKLASVQAAKSAPQSV